MRFGFVDLRVANGTMFVAFDMFHNACFADWKQRKRVDIIAYWSLVYNSKVLNFYRYKSFVCSFKKCHFWNSNFFRNHGKHWWGWCQSSRFPWRFEIFIKWYTFKSYTICVTFNFQKRHFQFFLENTTRKSPKSLHL